MKGLVSILWTALIVCLSAPAHVLAAPYPAGPVKILVGFPPGGTTDVIGRLLAKGLSEELGKPVVVENRPGVSGGIAGGAVARSAPDGLTLLFVSSTHATNPALYKSLPYDTAKDFAPVSLVATTPYVLTVHPDLPVDSFAGFLRYLNEHPGEVNYASASPGTGQHLAAELFGRMAAVKTVHVPYKGSAAAMPDVLSGRIQMMFENVAVMTPHIRRGALRPLAVTGAARSQLLPQIPTVAESGLAGFEVVGWFGLLAPAATPAEVVEALNTAVNKVLAADELRKKLDDMGAEPVGGTPQTFNRFLSAEISKWDAVIRDAGITVN
jgi:tripartite-type tricarboxylate transporter receptor subunit TctC